MADNARLFAIPILLLFTLPAQGQGIEAFPPDTGSTAPYSSIRFEGSYAGDANTIYDDLLQALRRGGFVDRSVRQRSSDALLKENRAGLEFDSRLTLISGDSVFRVPGLQWMVSIAHHDLIGVRFAPDVYDLTFFGNAQFEGTEAQLGNSAYEQIRYQSLGGGLHWSKSGSWLRIDFLNGQNLNAAAVHDASLFTATDGRSLEGRLNGSYQQSDTSDQGSFSSNGWGLALGYSHSVVIGAKEKRVQHTFTARVEDLGFIRWNAKSLSTTKDTTFNFQGIRIENIFALDDVIIGEQGLLDTLGIIQEQKAFIRNTPFRAALSYSMRWRSGWGGAFTLTQRAIAGYVPQALLEVDKKFGKKFLVGISGQYGGFGLARVGLRFRYRLKEHFELDVHSRNVVGSVTSTARGTSLGCALSMFW